MVFFCGGPFTQYICFDLSWSFLSQSLIDGCTHLTHTNWSMCPSNSDTPARRYLATSSNVLGKFGWNLMNNITSIILLFISVYCFGGSLEILESFAYSHQYGWVREILDLADKRRLRSCLFVAQVRGITNCQTNHAQNMLLKSFHQIFGLSPFLTQQQKCKAFAINSLFKSFWSFYTLCYEFQSFLCSILLKI